MNSDLNDAIGLGILIIIAFALIAGFTAFACQGESKAYNRLTGANTTAWDAFWLELRVEGEAK